MNEPPDGKQAYDKSHKQARARVEHAFARMGARKTLRDCRLKEDGVSHATSGIARLHDLALAGQGYGAQPPPTLTRRSFGGQASAGSAHKASGPTRPAARYGKQHV